MNVTRQFSLSVAFFGLLLLTVILAMTDGSSAAARMTEVAGLKPTLTITAVFFRHSPTSSTSLVINEIDYDQPSVDAAEFLEIKNISSAPINLAPYEIYLVNGVGGGASVYQVIELPDVDLAPGGYFVICANAATVAICDLDVEPNENLIQNGEPDAVAIMLAGQVIDAVSYEGDTGAPYTEGSGAGLSDSAYIASLGIARYPDGVDTNRNNVDFSRRCISPGERNKVVSSQCDVTITPTPTPTPPPTNTPPPETTLTATPLPTNTPPTPEETFTPSATPTSSATPTVTATPLPATPTAVAAYLPHIKTLFFSTEPNNNAAQANGPIPSGELVYGRFAPGDQRSDYYYLDLHYPYTIYATLTNIPPSEDYDLIIRDIHLNVIGYSAEFNNADERALTAIVPPGRYFIQVYNPFATASNLYYHLKVIYTYDPLP